MSETRISAGDLNQRAAFQSPPTATNEYGVVPTDWTTQFVTFCEITPVGFTETEQDKLKQATASFRVVTRPNAAKNTWRLEWNGRLLYIVSLLVTPWKQTMICEERL